MARKSDELSVQDFEECKAEIVLVSCSKVRLFVVVRPVNSLVSYRVENNLQGLAWNCSSFEDAVSRFNSELQFNSEL